MRFIFLDYIEKSKINLNLDGCILDFFIFFGSRLRTLSVSPPLYLCRSCLALEGHLGLMISYVISEWV